MARMYPRPLNPGTKEAPVPESERRVYRLLDEALDESWVVMHRVAWVAKRKGGELRDGEADFVLAHPDRGLMVLEAKGGRIGRDGARGTWYSIDRDDRRHEIHDPFEQAATSMHVLADRLHDLAGWPRHVTMVHAVTFPDCAVAGRHLGVDGPPELVMDVEGLQDPRAWVEAAFEAYRPAGGFQGPSAEALERLVEVMAPTWELGHPLAADLAADDRKLLRLAEGQVVVLDAMARRRRLAICGGAGTGKSILAAHKARRLAAEGFRVLLTCFNQPLAVHLSRCLADAPDIHVTTFHTLCQERAKAAGLPVREPDPANPAPPSYFNDDLPDLLDRALKMGGDRYDALVVDEGQDFRGHWWVALLGCLEDPDRDVLYVFLDDQQSIYGSAPSLPPDLETTLLYQNLRNTKAIHDFAERLCPDVRLEPRGPAGRPPEVVEVPEESDLKKVVNGILTRWIEQERIPPRDIAVLSGTSLVRSRLGPKSIGNVPVTNDPEDRSGVVVLQTIHKFKGLDRKAVILADIDGQEGPKGRALLYVGATRARTHLAVAAAPATLRRFGMKEE